jgi:integrase
MAKQRHPHFYRKRGIWYVWGLKASGERWVRSTRTKDYREAERRARDIRKEVLSAPDLSAQASQTLEDALAELYDGLKRAKRKPGTIRSAVQRGGHLVRVLGKHLDIAAFGVHEKREPLLRGYIATRLDDGSKHSTIAAEIAALKQALIRAARAGLWRGVARDLMPEELKGAHVPRTTWHTQEQARRMVAKLRPQWQEHAETYLETGVRRMELYTIEATSIDYDGNRVKVMGTKTKKAERWLPMSPRVRTILTRRAKETPEGPLFREWTHVLPDLRQACERAKVPVVTVTDLRRTFASTLLNLGVTASVLKEILGHTTTKQIDIVYGQIGDVAKQEAIDRLTPGSRAVAGAKAPKNKTRGSGTRALAKSREDARRHSTSGNHMLDAFRGLSAISDSTVAKR